jgi:predicted nucleic acid-binding Zn ribbon protein
MKNCIVCSKEFEQKTNKGLEQKYCSQLCRMKAYNERKETKANEELNQLRQQAQSNNSIVPSKIIGIEPNGNPNNLQFGNVWNSLLEGNYHKLKVESLEERLKEKDQTIDELKKEIMILENQIESLEDEIDQAPGEQGGFSIGKIIENPLQTIQIVNGLVDIGLNVVEKFRKKPQSQPHPQSKTA